MAECRLLELIILLEKSSTEKRFCSVLVNAMKRFFNHKLSSIFPSFLVIYLLIDMVDLQFGAGG